MTGQQYPTREQIAEPAADELFDLALDGGGTRGDALLRIYRRGVEDVFALLPQPTQECGVCGSQYPADDPNDTCPVCWPGFGEHGQHATTSAEVVACPHWERGRITMRNGCTACAAEAAPVSIADMAPMDLAAQTAAVRYVDAEYMEEGGSTRHWVQALNRAGYVIAPDPSTIRDVQEPPTTPEAD